MKVLNLNSAIISLFPHPTHLHTTRYECVIQQGSGTFVVESVLSSVVPPPAAGGRILVVSNGTRLPRLPSPVPSRTKLPSPPIIVFNELAGTDEVLRPPVTTWGTVHPDSVISRWVAS